MNIPPKYLSILKSYLRAFLAAILVAYMAGETSWKGLLAAGVAAVVGPLAKALDPSETAFGRGAE